LREYLESIHTRYREIFSEVENEINSQLSGVPLKSYSFILKTRLKRVIDEYNSKTADILKTCSCSGCGVCCRFAVSEFSPQQLREKADSGDSYASQFLSVFVPYNDSFEYSEIFPEYIELLGENEEYYVYHCPNVTEDNRCPDYENRPQICKDFPDNPIAFLPKTCGYKPWKLQSENLCLRLRAEKEIINYLLSE
jgi:Fe-S-cluster containining protein